MSQAFDAMAAIAELTQGLTPYPNHSRISFPDRCAAFCALYSGMPHSIVARAFGVTKTTVSLLAGCLPGGLDHRVRGLDFEPDADGKLRPVAYVRDFDPNKNRDPARRARYQDVAREFVRLGREEFTSRYYTDEIHVRLMKAKHQSGSEDLGRGQHGANSAAAKFSFKFHGAVSCADTHYRIDWIPKGRGEFEGWHYSPCNEDGTPMGEYDWVYFIEGEEARAFRTSAEAYDALFTLNGLESPRPKSGRPKMRK